MKLDKMSQMFVMNRSWEQNNASFYGYCQIQNRTAKVRKCCQNDQISFTTMFRLGLTVSDFKAKMHQIRIEIWGNYNSLRSPDPLAEF